jgi:hypothetical protein
MWLVLLFQHQLFFGVIQGLHLFAFSSFVYELVSIFITFSIRQVGQ